jgi:hypothetical protein
MMKKILLTAVVASASFSAFAIDGTFSASNTVTDPVTKQNVREYVFDVDGSQLAKAKGAVQFVINGNVVGTGTYGFLLNGLFSAGAVNIPNAAGNTVSITIEVWDKTTAATYEQAMLTGNYLPAQTVSVVLGGSGTPAAPPAGLWGFTGGKLIPAPEPSTIALAALGLGGLLFISRRK